MTRISRTTNGNRIRESYVQRMTNVDKIRFVEKIDQVERSTASDNHSSENFLIAYDHYYKTIEDLKKSFKRFYSFGNESNFLIQKQKEKLIDQMVQLVEKYNEAVTSLGHLDKLEGTNYIKTFHLIFTTFANDFLEIGIYENENYTLTFEATILLNWLERTDQTAITFIRQFKLALMKEYQFVFQELSQREDFIIKGLVIEEEG